MKLLCILCVGREQYNCNRNNNDQTKRPLYSLKSFIETNKLISQSSELILILSRQTRLFLASLLLKVHIQMCDQIRKKKTSAIYLFSLSCFLSRRHVEYVSPKRKTLQDFVFYLLSCFLSRFIALIGGCVCCACRLAFRLIRFQVEPLKGERAGMSNGNKLVSDRRSDDMQIESCIAFSRF